MYLRQIEQNFILTKLIMFLYCYKICINSADLIYYDIERKEFYSYAWPVYEVNCNNVDY